MIVGMNTRVLIIDDEESVRDGFREVLAPRERDTSAMDSAASALFGEVTPHQQRQLGLVDFKVDTAASGPKGVALVEASVAAGAPYAVIFCDMRMPIMDGLETVERIRELDRRAEVVFVTAYSDHSLQTIVDRAGANVGYFVKPFLSEEILQLATKLVMSWNRARELEDLLTTLASLRGETDDVDHLLRFLLMQVCRWLGSDSAALLRTDGERLSFHLGVGVLQDEAALLARFPDPLSASKFSDHGEACCLPIPDYGVAIALADIRLTPDRLHMVEVFLRYAGLAIRNATINAELNRKRRMAAMGQAVGYLIHDLRGPIGFSQMLLQTHRDSPGLMGSTEEVYGKLERSLERALDMLNDTLAFCRGGIQIHPEATDLAETLAEPAELWRLALEHEKVELELQIAPGAAGRADPEMLIRALWNLIKNAANAARGRAPARVSVSAWRSGAALLIAVSDTGPGVPEHLRETLFLPFVSGERTTGFGLAIVKEIVEVHGGEIDVAFGDEGTRFTIQLPDSP